MVCWDTLKVEVTKVEHTSGRVGQNILLTNDSKCHQEHNFRK